MKRLLAMSSLSLTAVFLFVSLADGQSGPVRAATQQVTSNTTPQRDRSRPYTFTTTGRVVPPPPCAPGVFPTVPGGNCVPAICPPGATNPAYCVQVPRVLLCTGKVTVRFKKAGGPYTISARSVGLRPDCTFRSRVSFRTRNPLRRGTLRVYTRFEGNPFLLPKNGPTRTVRAG